MRNFARINNYYNRIEAQRDWAWLADWCQTHGVGDVAAKAAPDADAGFRKIDKAISRLRTELAERGIELPPCPSSQPTEGETQCSQPS